MRICIVTQQYHNIHSGIGLYATNLVNKFHELGHELTVICSPDCRTDRLPRGIKYYIAAVSRLDPSPNRWISFSCAAAKILRALGQRCGEVIHYTDAREALFLKRPMALTIGNVNDFFIADARKNPFYYKKHLPAGWFKMWGYYNGAKILDKIAFKKLGHLIANTKFVAEKITEKYQLDPKRISVIYKSIDLSVYEKKIQPIPKPGQPTLLFVAGGNFQKKGIHTIIQAVSQLKEEFPRIKVWTVGRDVTQKILFSKFKGDQKEIIDNHFIFLGNIDNQRLPQYYKSSDIFVRPSLMEAFGVTYLEAMACGTPAIGGINGGTKELIINGKNGFLVDPERASDLASIIKRMAIDADLRKKIILEGLKTVRSYNLDDMARLTLDTYRLLLSQKNLIKG